MPITEASTKKLRLLCPWRSSSVQRRKKKFDKKMTVARAGLFWDAYAGAAAWIFRLFSDAVPVSVGSFHGHI